METPVSNIIQTGDLGGQKVKMQIDENALAHIMSVLTDMYSDPQMAVIREYSTNARDSHIEAGNTAPIEVTTPSGLSPFFKIKDYGVGLSVDDIINMYSKYGASTKRETNEQNGMLGIGAKSALTLVPQFNITSVKGGVRILVSVSRDSSGAGQMEIIDTRATSEPNGVEISIPVQGARQFIDKCDHFFKFWERGTVLVNGQEPERIDGRWVGDNIVIDKSLNEDYIVMGNVAYPVKEGLYGNGWSKTGIVAFVPIGDVNFTPSREQLTYTVRTKETIQRVKREFLDKIVNAANVEIASAKTHSEAWELATEWRQTFRSAGMDQLTYKGSRVPTELALNGKWREVDLFAYRARRGYSYTRAIYPSTKNTLIFITGFAESLKMSPAQRERVTIYCKQNNIAVTRASISTEKDLPLIDWTKDLHVVDWSVIAKIKVDRAVTQRAVRTDPYDLYTGTWNYTSVSTLDTSKDIIYISPAENNRPDFLTTMYPDAQIVILGKNRWEKFARDWPTASHFEAKMKADKEKFVKDLTDDDKVLWHYWGNYRHSFSGWDASGIDDPDLKRFIELMSKPIAWSPAAKSLKTMPHQANVSVPCPDNPLTKYPLAGSMSRTDRSHMTWYFNTYHAHLTKENN